MAPSNSSSRSSTPGDAAAAFPAGDSSATCQATLSQGGLSGKRTGTTCEYLGVPYGAPPTGARRFMPPQPAAGWSTPRDAADAGAPVWPSYSTTGDEYLVLSDPTPMASAHLAQARCDFWASFTPLASM
jgi:hypothetical protein